MLPIKLLDGGILPLKAEAGSIGLDIKSREEVVIPGLMQLYLHLKDMPGYDLSEKLITTDNPDRKISKNDTINRKLIKTGICLDYVIHNGQKLDNYYVRVAPRSGLALAGIDVVAGVVDKSYRNEVGVILNNNNLYDVRVKPGDRIAQLIVEKAVNITRINEVEELSTTERGTQGFGSSGSSGDSNYKSGKVIVHIPESKTTVLHK